MELMTVGEIAKKMGVTVRTLQYYDREGVLSPTQLSKGGRRMYTEQDLVKLHQIVTFKYLGFSLDEIKTKVFSTGSPQELLAVLGSQRRVIEEKLQELRELSEALALLEAEVNQIEVVDFHKYAAILQTWRDGNKGYWQLKHYEEPLFQYAAKQDADALDGTYDTYLTLLHEAKDLLEAGASPTSEQGQDFAQKWWQMVMDFTAGDLSLLPSLLNYNADKSRWDPAVAALQQEADPFLHRALAHYCTVNQIDIGGIFHD